ncbi:MAG: ATP-binding protein [Gammaproteobacteria bacterium]|nr:ATP-binding protein [Gammaproteobacteria bacterium]MDH5734874.1 ATP-binding protein [Gammaproteobacteria bacterium]
MKLQSRFLLVYGLGGIAFLAATTFVVFFSMQNSMTEKLESQFLANAEIKFAKAYEVLNDITLHFQANTRLPMFRLYRYHNLTLNEPAKRDDIRQLELFFHEQQNINPTIIRTQFIDTDGFELLHIENKNIIKKHRDLSKNTYIKQALLLNAESSSISILPDSKQPERIVWWLPVYVANNVHIGILAIHVDFNYIRNIINSLSENKSEWSCLYDENYILLSSSLADKKCNNEINNLWSYTKSLRISNINWPLTIQTHQDNYLEEVITLRWVIFGFILPFIAAIAFLTILITSRHITTTIKSIVQSAHSLGSDSTYIPGNITTTDELNELSAELNRTAKLIQIRTNELIQSNKELESFSYTIAHDLRTPLRTIVGFSQILMKHTQDKLDDNSIEYLNRITSATHKMSNLIDKILELSRITRIESHFELVNLSTLSELILNDLSATDPDKKIKWNIENEMIVKGDAHLLKALLENILGNSWKYTNNNEYSEIQFYTRTETNRTIYCIQDNGAGFDMKYIDKLFKPFERLHNKNDFEGTGVGLASAERIIKKHHGHIWAESRLDQGTTLYFTINE